MRKFLLVPLMAVMVTILSGCFWGPGWGPHGHGGGGYDRGGYDRDRGDHGGRGGRDWR
jgi:hypothetical protein